MGGALPPTGTGGFVTTGTPALDGTEGPTGFGEVGGGIIGLGCAPAPDATGGPIGF